MTRSGKRNVVIVGGGVIGVCCAYYLARRGAAVTVLERDELCAGASSGNAGCIAPGHPPINKPGRIKQALQSLASPLSPLHVVPRWDPSLVAWLWSFSRHCSAAHLAHALRSLAPLGHATIELFDRLVDEESLDCAYRRDGFYEVFRTEAGLAGATHEAALVRDHGFAPEVLTGGALREREPAFSRSLTGGVFYPEAASVDPNRFVLELADRAARRGVTFSTGCDVVAVETKGPGWAVRTARGETARGDAVLFAMGAYGGRLLHSLGCDLPLQAAKGYHRDRDPQKSGTPPLGVTAMLGERSVFCTPMSGRVRFAGTLEFSGLNHEIRRPRLEQLTESAKVYFDGMEDADSLSEWCGLRPCIADGLPAVGPIPGRAGLFVATGHAMLGLTLGPVTGKLMAEYVLDGRPSIGIDAFRPDRF